VVIPVIAQFIMNQLILLVNVIAGSLTSVLARIGGKVRVIGAVLAI
jgi:hypothetical protein